MSFSFRVGLPAFAMMRGVSVSGEVSEVAEVETVETVACDEGCLTLS